MCYSSQNQKNSPTKRALSYLCSTGLTTSDIEGLKDFVSLPLSDQIISPLICCEGMELTHVGDNLMSLFKEEVIRNVILVFAQ